MSVHIFRGGKFHPQSGGRLISSNLRRPPPFLPKSQVGYGVGGVLKPIARKLLSTLKSQAKKIPGYLGRVAKRQGKKAAKEIIVGLISGKIKKGKRKQAIKRIAVSNLKQAKQNIQKILVKEISRPKQKSLVKKTNMPKQKKTSRKRKPFFLAYKNKPTKRRRKYIFDK